MEFYQEILERVEMTSSLSEKTRLLASGKDDPNLRYILDVGLNFFRKFGIKSFKIPKNSGPGVGFDAFKALIEKLECRLVTGSAAVIAVEELLLYADAMERKWFSRAILKDLKLGAGISVVAKAGIDIPKFDVMLAKDGKLGKKTEQIVSNGVWVSRKYDGYRCIAEVENYKVRLLSRNGAEYQNFPVIAEAIETLAHLIDRPSFVLDGEMMSNDFSSMQQSAFASQRGTTVGDVKYYIFDLIPKEEWESQNFQETCDLRYANLTSILTIANNKRNEVGEAPLPLVEVEHTWVTSMAELQKLERQYIEEGYEGAMAIPNIPYYLGRKTNAMMKFKTMQSMDCIVTGKYQGDGKYRMKLGGLTVTQENGKPCSVGSGFTDQERTDLWLTPADSINGRICEIKYQGLSDDGIMRFPIFIRWRDRGNGDKI